MGVGCKAWGTNEGRVWLEVSKSQRRTSNLSHFFLQGHGLPCVVT